MILLFDTETTGLAKFDLPHTHPLQPRLVQLACQVFSSSGTRPLHTFCFIVKPEGFVIPKEASDIHGITQEIALEIGVASTWIVKLFNGFLQKATLLVAHNVEFDSLVMNNELGQKGLESIKVPSFCTKVEMTNYCKLPGKYGRFKWPTLQEAYRHVTGKDPEHSHDALEDLNSLKIVYDYLQSIDTQNP